MTTPQSFEDYLADNLPKALMEAGIGVKPASDLLPLHQIPDHDITVYYLKREGGWESESMAFTSLEDAEKALDSCKMRYDKDRKKLSAASYVINAVKAHSVELAEAHKQLMEENEKIKQHNSRVTDAVGRWESDVSDVRNKLWAGYIDLLDEQNLRIRIKDTFEDYKNLSNGDAEVAKNFLYKAFSKYEEAFLDEVIGE